MKIIRWDQNQSKQFKKEFRNIFFLCSSRKSFDSENEEDQFFHRWTSYYFTHRPQEIFLAFDGNKEILGYLTGCSDSHSATEYFRPFQESYSLFASEFENFPAHLHINCHPGHQGKGVGRYLIEHYCESLKESGVTGVHIVTQEGADNAKFYEKLGFSYQRVKSWNDLNLLFMGRKI